MHVHAGRKHKQIAPTVVNGSVHTGHKQHQRIGTQICVLVSSVDWVLVRDLEGLSCPLQLESGWRE